MPPSIFENLRGLPGPRKGGSETAQELHAAEEELEQLAEEEPHGHEQHLKKMVRVAWRVQDLEVKLFELHLEEMRHERPREAAEELDAVLKQTAAVEASKKREFGRVAQTWHYSDRTNALEKYADIKYVNFKMLSMRLTALKELEGRHASHTTRGRSSLVAGNMLGAGGGGSEPSASRRAGTPVPTHRIPDPDRLEVCTPVARSAAAAGQEEEGEEARDGLSELHRVHSTASVASAPFTATGETSSPPSATRSRFGRWGGDSAATRTLKRIRGRMHDS
ncbi:hypothetical protein JCM10450v2_002292 [Rhodotorula kratochvilovae]